MSKSFERPYKAFGDKLLTIIREDKRQKEVARELYLSQSEVSNILSGKRRPAAWRVGWLAFLYQESPEYLAQLAGYDLNPDTFQKVIDSYTDRVRLLADNANGNGGNE